jgi:hypothetical protein
VIKYCPFYNSRRHGNMENEIKGAQGSRGNREWQTKQSLQLLNWNVCAIAAFGTCILYGTELLTSF